MLKDISFESHAGEVTAIIGRTGCGKSSVLKLVPRLYDAMFGHIYVDGMDVKKYKLEELRGLIGYVPQKNVLFSGDVASNLRFGDEQSGEEQWREAAHIACADEFIEQKDGAYHAAIAQGGMNLSGGQRQRMAIARAVVKQPEIYLFDDSFSALDMKTDRTLRARLREIWAARRCSSSPASEHHPRRRPHPRDGRRPNRRQRNAQRTFAHLRALPRDRAVAIGRGGSCP